MEKKLVNCPECKREWPYISEQGSAITLIGHCIVCMCDKLAGAMYSEPIRLIERLNEHGIIAERNRREKEAGYEVEPCPRCLQGRSKDCHLCGGTGSIFYEREKGIDEAGASDSVK